MKDPIISKETAILADEKGYPFEYIGTTLSDIPTQTSIQTWLREEKKIFVQVQTLDGSKYWCNIWDLNTVTIQNKYKLGSIGITDGYEKSLEIGLQEALKLEF